MRTLKLPYLISTVNLLKVFLGDPKKPLRSAQARIKENIDRFDKEGRVDIDEQILQRLPASIPETGLFDVPYLRNEYFHGREAVLKDLHHKLSSGDNHAATRSCLIHAMGGMGKTQVALEYTYRHIRQYRCIFWLGAERVQELAVGYASIAVKLQLPDINSIGQGRRIELVRKWFETTGTFATTTKAHDSKCLPSRFQSFRGFSSLTTSSRGKVFDHSFLIPMALSS